jgi:EF-P beta-lysylation protein EpmB
MWHQSLEKNFQSFDNLFSFLGLDNQNQKKILISSTFKLNLPYRLAKKIKKDNLLNDPIFKQFVPSFEEEKVKRGFCLEPIKDSSFQNFNLIQKYKNRALLICSNKCAMHCRFCFRKNFNYHLKDSLFKNELALLQKKKEISELILSGGDPLMMENEDLNLLMEKIEKMAHLKRVRFHTRMLIAFPERVDEFLLKIFKNFKKQIIFVLHVNHPQELDEEVFSSIRKLQLLNIPFLSQSVLLKKINNDPNILLRLFELLSNHGVLPYYLHQLDKVQGTTHFEVSMREGKKIIRSLKSLTSGYNIPSYVKEVPYEKSKISII